MIDLNTELNTAQREAVCYDGGPSLVIAGAGSGKTRVLTYKLAHLLQKGYEPSKILALTFTNKAAREMLERVEQMVGVSNVRQMQIGTFHSVFARYLRRYASAIGFTPQFSIYDKTDSQTLIKQISKELQLDSKVYVPKLILHRISECKNRLIAPEQYATEGYSREDSYKGIPLMGQLYDLYMKRCKQSNAMDFDDLLYYFNVLLRDNPLILKECQENIDYLLIDEYQDTNFSQYRIVRKLVEHKQRIFAVGDDAQSIYSFRGADLQNILFFTQAFPSARIFKLEENYRSTQSIVGIANSLIKHNVRQIPKNVFSQQQQGERVQLRSLESSIHEAQFVCNDIKKRCLQNGEVTYKDFSILYRTNAQSRLFEEQLRGMGIPYHIYGGQAFYSHAEIKNILAYLQLIVNPHHNEAFERAAQYPKKGIGNKTLLQVRQYASENNLSLYDATKSLVQKEKELSSSAQKHLADYLHQLEQIATPPENQSLFYWIKEILQLSGILADLEKEDSIEALSKYENVREFLSGVQESEERSWGPLFEQDNINSVYEKLLYFLQNVTLSTDNQGEGKLEESVNLMTLHASKGLEFKYVYIVGLEEGLFPSPQSFLSEDIEEERRLLYVGITRAKEVCTLTHTANRRINGLWEYMLPSRFLRELNSKYLKVHTPTESFYMGGGDATQEGEDKEIVLDSILDNRPSLESSLQETLQNKLPDSNHSFAPSQRGASGSKRATPIPYSHRKAHTPSQHTQQENIEVGDQVYHETMGRGVVEAITGTEVNRIATIQFEQVGRRDLFLRFAILSKL